jgi:hypothetical protein
VVIALASRSTVKRERLDRRQVSQWAFGLAGVRIPSPAPFYQLVLISKLFGAKNLYLRVKYGGSNRTESGHMASLLV